jgi:hypothetical protein
MRQLDWLATMCDIGKYGPPVHAHEWASVLQRVTSVRAAIEHLYAENDRLHAELAEEKRLSTAISRDCNDCANQRNAERARAEKAEAERDELRAKLSAPAGAASAKASRYSWKGAPEWAMWAATDEMGGSAFFAEKPVLSAEMWWVAGSAVDRQYVDIELSTTAKPCPDWRDSLEPRPAADEPNYSSMDYGNAMVETSTPAADGGVE